MKIWHLSSKLTPFCTNILTISIFYCRYPQSRLSKDYTDNPGTFERSTSLKIQINLLNIGICSPFQFFHTVFQRFHSHGHFPEKLPIKSCNEFFYIPQLPLSFSIFIHDCLRCQKINTSLQNKTLLHVLFLWRRYSFQLEKLDGYKRSDISSLR